MENRRLRPRLAGRKPVSTPEVKRLFWLAVLGINILGMIPCGLGLFITIPLTFLAHAHIYRRLEYAAEVAQPVAPTPVPAQPFPPAPGG